MNSHRNVVFNAQADRDWVGLSKDDVAFGVAPFFHITGLIGNLAAPLLTGMPIVMSYRFDADTALALIYWEKPEETAYAIPGGALHTGDVGFMDEHGWFYLVDRKKDQINAAGYKIWPRDVEDVLYGHAAVREVAVIGVPDEYRGETVKAFVSLKPGESVDEQALIAFCRERMAAYKYPRQIEVHRRAAHDREPQDPAAGATRSGGEPGRAVRRVAAGSFSPRGAGAGWMACNGGWGGGGLAVGAGAGSNQPSLTARRGQQGPGGKFELLNSPDPIGTTAFGKSSTHVVLNFPNADSARGFGDLSRFLVGPRDV
jgi:acyl-CoA synthetase (AMP-forming)/AMP-acid ligase II